MSSDNNKGCSGVIVVLCFIVLVFSIVVFSPGMSVVLMLAGGHIDRGQAWVFGIIVSILIWLGLFLIARKEQAEKPATDALGVYGIICLLTTATYAIAHFGFHADWPIRHLNNVIVIWEDDEQERMAHEISNDLGRMERLSHKGNGMTDRDREELHDLAISLQRGIAELGTLRRRQGDKLPRTWDAEVTARLTALAQNGCQ